MKPPSDVDEARQRIRAALNSRPLAIAPEAIDLVIEQAAMQLASGQPEQSQPVRLVPIRPGRPATSGGTRPAGPRSTRRRKPATATSLKPGPENQYGLIVPGQPERPRELEVHFSERQPSGVTVTIGSEAAEQIVAHATRRGGHTEEGGLLCGPRPGFRGEITVRTAAGPGSDAHRTADHYRPDHAHDLAFVAERKKWLATNDFYELGVWHLHVSPDATTPSSGDLQFFAGMLQFVEGSSYVGVILAPRRYRDGFAASAWVTTVGDPLARDPWFRCQPASLIVEGHQSWSVA